MRVWVDWTPELIFKVYSYLRDYTCYLSHIELEDSYKELEILNYESVKFMVIYDNYFNLSLGSIKFALISWKNFLKCLNL